MYTTTIQESMKKVILSIADKYHISKKSLLRTYFNENFDNNFLTFYQYEDYTLFKDCYDNIYLPNETNKTIELIGHIVNNEIIFDKNQTKVITKKNKKTITQSNKEDT